MRFAAILLTLFSTGEAVTICSYSILNKVMLQGERFTMQSFTNCNTNGHDNLRWYVRTFRTERDGEVYLTAQFQNQARYIYFEIDGKTDAFTTSAGNPVTASTSNAFQNGEASGSRVEFTVKCKDDNKLCSTLLGTCDCKFSVSWFLYGDIPSPPSPPPLPLPPFPPQQSCKCDAVRVSGAEDGQPSLMGVFDRFTLQTPDGRSVYRNSNGKYLYYWPEHDDWKIGDDYKSSVASVQSTSDSEARCPEDASDWSATSFGGADNCALGGATLNRQQNGDNLCVCPRGTSSCSGGCDEGEFADDSSLALYWRAGTCAGCACGGVGRRMSDTCVDDPSCPHLGDGDCDDGGDGSAYALCAFASDCTDCGPRPLDPTSGTAVSVTCVACPAATISSWRVYDLEYDLDEVFLQGGIREIELASSRESINDATFPTNTVGFTFTSEETDSFSFELTEASREEVGMSQSQTESQTTIFAPQIPLGELGSLSLGSVEWSESATVGDYQSEEFGTTYTEGTSVEKGTAKTVEWPPSEVPPCTRVVGKMLGTKRVVEVPFTARLKPASAAPDNCNYEVRGTFKGVEITTVRLKVEEDNDFEFDGACASFSDAASPPSPPPPKKDIPGSDTIDDNSSDGDGIAPIVGGAVGGLVATFVFVIVLVYLLKKRAQPKVPPACPPVTVGVEVHAAAPPPAGSARLSTY